MPDFLRGNAEKSRDELIMQFKVRLMRQSRPDTEHHHGRKFLPPAYTPCVTPLSDLRKVMIRDLRLQTHNRGTYVLLRSVTPADTMTAVMAIVEDENKDGITLQLFYQAEENERFAEEILPEGTVVIVKEPCLKIMTDGDCGLFVDHLFDVTFEVRDLIPNQWQHGAQNERVPPNTLKMRGNNCFSKSKYFEAIKHYSQGIICFETEEEGYTLRLNRSMAYLKTKQFDAALSDLEHAMVATKATEKALFRKAQALYGLERYRECIEVLRILCVEFPSSTATTEQNRATNRLAEQTTGVYQFKQLHTEASTLRPPHLDHSTYLGPVEVRASHSKGRGLFTTAAVKAGDLLLCEKAFAHAFHDSGKKIANQIAPLDILETDSKSIESQAELVQKVIQKLQRNPSLNSIITDLYPRINLSTFLMSMGHMSLIHS